MLRLNDMQRPGHAIAPVAANMLGNGANHGGAGVLEEPVLAAAVQQDGVVGEYGEGLGAVLAEDVDKLCRDGGGEGGDGVVARPGGQVIGQVKRPLELLDGGAAGLEAGVAEVRPGEEGVQGLALGAVLDDAQAGLAGDFEQRAELRVGEELPRRADDGDDAAVEVEAVDKRVDEAVEVGVGLAQDGERVAERVHAQDAGEEEARDARRRVAGLEVGCESCEAGNGARLQFCGLVAQRGDGELRGRGREVGPGR